jgi:predicted dehydrogenase
MIKSSAALAGGVALSSAIVGRAHAGEDNTIRLALIGCGGRGRGAVVNAIQANVGPVKLHAMADLFENKLHGSLNALSRYKDHIDVPAERQFFGFDAYRKAIDTLRPGDVALLTAYSYCRPQHMEYAVGKGVHVFMEKPFAPDPGSLHRMLRAGEEADKKNVKVAAGLMCRHSEARQALIEKIRSGELGDIVHVRAYRMWGGRGLGAPPSKDKELMWQLAHRTHFHWAGSGSMIEMLIHQIDECCWIKDAWPVSCHGLGGRVPYSNDHGQNLHVYAMEYTFPDGTKATVDARSASSCHNDFSTYLHGTKHAAQFSGNVHAPTVRVYQKQRAHGSEIAWHGPRESHGPHCAEWIVLLNKIRNDEPHNETQRAVYADFASIMGRAACHTGRIVTWDDMLKSNFQFCNSVDSLTHDSPAPVTADENGYYPAPIPGKWQEV